MLSMSGVNPGTYSGHIDCGKGIFRGFLWLAL